MDDDKTQRIAVLDRGTYVSHYAIISRIGAGGMGEVYLAEDTELNRKVALKFLSPHLCQDADCKARFKREAQAAAKLDHPNIVTVHEVGEFQERPFFAMQHIEGRSLREYAHAQELTIPQILEIGIQIAEGLQAAHEKGVTHRDIKPANVLIDSHGRVRILDFGLASVAGVDHLTKTGSTLGTIGYMSPEQVRGEHVDHRTDIFSLGVVLYELITGRQPFKGDNDTATSRNIIDHEPEPLARYKTGVDAELQRIIQKALQKDRTLRYQHGDEISADLKSVRNTGGTSASTRAPSRSTLLKGKWTYLIATLAILAIAFVLLKTYVLRPGDEPLDSLAVLPLQNLSSDPDQEYFSDGMTEALITELQKIRSLRVISRTSVMRFKKSNESLSEIAKKLTVKAIVEGSVLREGDNVRITIQLIQVSPEKHLWASNFDRPMSGILAMQSDVAKAIAQEVNSVVSPEEYRRLRQTSPVNPEAYQAYLKGRYYWNKRQADAMQRAIAYFSEAINIDSSYAPAYTGLAATYALLPEYAYLPPGECYVRADSVALIALRLDPSIAEAHAVMGVTKYYQWQWNDAMAELEQAIALNPRYPTAHHWYSNLLRSLGRLNEALVEIKLAQELDPLSLVINVNVGITLFWLRRDAEAVEQFRKTLELDPDYPVVHSFLGNIYEAQGKLGDAITEYVLEAAKPGSGYFEKADLGRAYARVGKTQEAQQILNELLHEAQDKPFIAASIATVYDGLRDTVKTWEWVEKAAQQRWGFLNVLVDPMCNGYRQHPRYKELLKKMGFPAM